MHYMSKCITVAVAVVVKLAVLVCRHISNTDTIKCVSLNYKVQQDIKVIQDGEVSMAPHKNNELPLQQQCRCSTAWRV